MPMKVAQEVKYYIVLWFKFCFLSLPLLLFLSLFLCITTLGQPVHQDSLAFLLEKEPKGVSDLIHLNNISWKLIESDTTLAKKIALRALYYSKKLGYEPNEALAYNRLGRLAHQSGDFNLAISYYTANLKIRKTTNDTIGQSNTYLNLGNTYKNIGNYEKAMSHYIQAISLLELYGEPDLLLKASIYNNMGSLYSMQSKGDESLKFYNKALELYKLTEDQHGYAGVCLNMGAQLVKKGKRKQGLDYLNQAYEIQQQLSDPSGVAKTLTNIGNVHFEYGDYTKAINHYEMAMLQHRSLGNKTEMARLFNNMGSCFTMLDSNLQAFSHYQKGLSIATQIKARGLQAQFFENIAYLEESSGNYRQAFNWFYSYDSLSSILLNESNNRQINELRVQYDLLKQENHTRLLESEKQDQELTITKQKSKIRLFVFILILTISIGVGSFIGYRQKRKANRLLRVQKEVIAQKEKEKELLLKELNHRVKNNLQIISSMLSLQSFELEDESALSALRAGQNRIEALSLIHQKLYQTEIVTHVDMPEYIDKLTSYISSSFEPLETKVKVMSNITIKSMEADVAIPIGLIINELVSNSYKHAFHNIEEPTIHIALEENSEMYNLRLNDNGCGFNPKSEVQESSFGLNLIRSLAKQIKGDWSMSSNSGFSISLQFPKS